MTTPSTLPRAWLAVLALLTAVGPLSVDMYLPTLPAMAGEFGADASRMQLTLLGFMAGMAVGQLVGPLSDRWGRHRLLIAGTLLSTGAGAACALAPSLEVLVGCRILQGLGGAAGVVLSRAIVADRSEGASAARAFSLMMIINGAAPIVAPLIGGSVAGIIGWRGIFWILAALSALMVLGATTVLSETRPAAARSERAGAGILGVLGNRSFLGYALTFAFGFSVMFAFISASPFVLQNVLGLSPVGNGIAVAANAFGLLGMNAVNARIVARYGAPRLLKTGAVLLVLFSGLVLLVVVIRPGWVLLLALWCTVSSLGLVVANATSLALDRVRRAAGAGSAVLGVLQYALAAVVSPLVGLAGSHTAVPMAITMVVCASASAAALTVLTPGR